LWKQKYAKELLPLQEKSIKEFNIFSGENIIVFASTSFCKKFIGEMVAIHYCSEHKKFLFCSYALQTTKGLPNANKNTKLLLFQR
jgi:superfamily II helicase